MDSIFVVVQKPDNATPVEMQEWQNFVLDIKELVDNSPEDAEFLSECAVLLRGERVLKILGTILVRAHTMNLSYEVLFLEKLTRWKSVADA